MIKFLQRLLIGEMGYVKDSFRNRSTNERVNCDLICVYVDYLWMFPEGAVGTTRRAMRCAIRADND